MPVCRPCHVSPSPAGCGPGLQQLDAVGTIEAAVERLVQRMVATVGHLDPRFSACFLLSVGSSYEHYKVTPVSYGHFPHSSVKPLPLLYLYPPACLLLHPFLSMSLFRPFPLVIYPIRSLRPCASLPFLLLCLWMTFTLRVLTESIRIALTSVPHTIHAMFTDIVSVRLLCLTKPSW